MEYLLNLGFPINIQDPDGKTPLHYAAHAGTTEIVQMLLEIGTKKGKKRQTAKVWIQDNDKLLAFYLAVRQGHVETIKLFHKRLQVIKEPWFEFNALGSAVISGNLEVVKLILMDSPYRSRVPMRSEIVTFATHNGHAEMLKYFHQNKWPAKLFKEALVKAAINKNFELVKWMVNEVGIDIKAPVTDRNDQLLHWAAHFPDLIEGLVGLGASLGCQDYGGIQ